MLWLFFVGACDRYDPSDIGMARPPEDPPTPTPDTPSVTPHVLLVLVDDMGWTGPSTDRTNRGNGSDYYLTPTIDRLAAAGVSFDAAYASPVCQASRALILSGQSAGRTKVYSNGDPNLVAPELRLFDLPYYDDYLDTEIVTLAETLENAGWMTGHFGKWHVGKEGSTGPEEQGFELNRGGTSEGLVTGGSDGHLAEYDGSWDLPNLEANGVPFQFMADRLTDEVIAFLGTEPERAKYAQLWHFSVHAPVMALDEDVEYFSGLTPGERHSDPLYAAMQYNLDYNLDRLLTYLETTEDGRAPGAMLIDNTLLILASDNGGSGGYTLEGVDTGREFTNNLPLYHGKSTTWEGGVRVPVIVRWDRGKQGGRIVSTPITLADIYPTVCGITGIPLPEGTAMDGADLEPLLVSDDPEWTRTDSFLHYPVYLDNGEAYGADILRETPTSVAWRGDYKLIYDWDLGAIEGEHAAWKLFDLATDIGETVNVADANPEIVQSVGTALVEWLVATDSDPLVDAATGEIVPWPDPSAFTVP